jgi:hypothetical protein
MNGWTYADVEALPRVVFEVLVEELTAGSNDADWNL